MLAPHVARHENRGALREWMLVWVKVLKKYILLSSVKFFTGSDLFTRQCQIDLKLNDHAEAGPAAAAASTWRVGAKLFAPIHTSLTTSQPPNGLQHEQA